MNSVKIKLIREGMITATEVKDRTGRILLASGKTITSKHLKVLKTWGITEINIMSSNETPSDSGQSDKSISVDPSIIKEMDKLFQFTDRRHPVVSEFYNLCLTRKVKEDV
jgi:hypothetical protein